MIALWLALVAAPHAETVAVVTHTDGGPVPLSATQSIVWHALAAHHGHDALLLASATDTVSAMQRAYLTRLVEVDVSWDIDVVSVEGGAVFAERPQVVVRQLRLAGDALIEVSRDTTWGRSVVRERDTGGWVALPEQALQDAIGFAAGSITPPAWTADPTAMLTIPVTLAADAPYRASHGTAWRREATARIGAANTVLAQAGLQLAVVHHQVWEADSTVVGLGGLLHDLAATERPDHALRIGFTGVGRAWDAPADAPDEVGRAFNPGHDLVVVDQAASDPRWDAIDEGVAVAHEVLHALGAPHIDHKHLVMSATKSSTVHVVHPRTAAIARTAAKARWALDDSVDALELLIATADAHLDDPELQIDYVLQNLVAGPGVPIPSQVPEHRMSALTTEFLARTTKGFPAE